MRLATVTVVLVEPVSLFELGVAVDVFGYDRTDDGVPRVDLRVCASRPDEPLVTEAGCPVSVHAGHGLDAVASSDLVVVSGTAARHPHDVPAGVLVALLGAHEAGATLLSLCTGAFVLGAAGLLQERACTTHWRHAADLARLYPSAAVDPRALYLHDGRIVTSAGSAAAIDACLHVVRRAWGHAAANAVARRMVVPPQRDGGQQQYVDLPVPAHRADSLAPLLDWVVEHLDHHHSTDSLARRVNMSRRTFIRRFQAEVGTTPYRWVSQQRVLAARSLLETTSLSMEQVAAGVGFGSAVVLRDHFRRDLGIPPLDYRRRFQAPTRCSA